MVESRTLAAPVGDATTKRRMPVRGCGVSAVRACLWRHTTCGAAHGVLRVKCTRVLLSSHPFISWLTRNVYSCGRWTVRPIQLTTVNINTSPPVTVTLLLPRASVFPSHHNHPPLAIICACAFNFPVYAQATCTSIVQDLSPSHTRT